MIRPLFHTLIDDAELDIAISDNFMVAIKCEHKCNCYEVSQGDTRATEYYYCRKSSDDTSSITNRDLIDILVKAGYYHCQEHNVLSNFNISETGAEATAIFV